MLPLKEEVARAYSETVDLNRVFTEAREESKQLLLVLNVAHVSSNHTEKLTCFLVTEFVIARDCTVQQLDYNTIIRLSKGLERPFSTVRVFCPVSWKLRSVLMTSAICRNGVRIAKMSHNRNQLIGLLTRNIKLSRKPLNLVSLVGIKCVRC